MKGSVTISGKSERIGVDADKYFKNSFYAYTFYKKKIKKGEKIIQLLDLWVFTDFLNENLKPEIIKALTSERSFLLSNCHAEEYFKTCLEDVKRSGFVELKGSATISGKSERIGVRLFDKEYYECEDLYECLEIYTFNKKKK